MKQRLISATVAASIAAAALGGAAIADSDKRYPESQYRHDLMEHFKYGIGNVVQIMKGESTHKDHLPVLAKIMSEAASVAKSAFEKDTRGMDGKTEAKDAIWENWDDYASRMDTFAEDAAAFAAVTASTDDMGQVGAAFKKFAGNCKSCHDKYKDD